jgi:hypothetical protein
MLVDAEHGKGACKTLEQITEWTNGNAKKCVKVTETVLPTIMTEHHKNALVTATLQPEEIQAVMITSVIQENKQRDLLKNHGSNFWVVAEEQMVI